MSYIGNTPTQQAFTPTIDSFSGDGSTTAFTLPRPVASVAQIQVGGAEASRQVIRGKYAAIQVAVDAAVTPEEIKTVLGV